MKNAGKAATEWSADTDDIDTYIARITELRNQLEQEGITAEESYAIKSELVCIQNELSGSYSDLSGNIDLVNDSLDVEIEKLEALKSAEAQHTLNENRSGFRLARREMETERADYLGQVDMRTEAGKRI